MHSRGGEVTAVFAQQTEWYRFIPHIRPSAQSIIQYAQKRRSNFSHFHRKKDWQNALQIDI